MVREGTPGKWVLWAIHSERSKPIVERHATFSGAREREAALRQAGYSVEIELSAAPGR
jgi:hypothetical protein